MSAQYVTKFEITGRCQKAAGRKGNRSEKQQRAFFRRKNYTIGKRRGLLVVAAAYPGAERPKRVSATFAASECRSANGSRLDQRTRDPTGSPTQ